MKMDQNVEFQSENHLKLSTIKKFAESLANKILDETVCTISLGNFQFNLFLVIDI